MYKLALFKIISHPVGQKINILVKMSEDLNLINPFCFLSALISFKRNLKSTTVEPLITVTSAQRPPPDLRSVKKVPAKFKVKLSQKNLPTVVASNQRPNGHFVLSQCLILSLLMVKKSILCKLVLASLLKFVLFIQKIYIFLKNHLLLTLLPRSSACKRILVIVFCNH